MSLLAKFKVGSQLPNGATIRMIKQVNIDKTVVLCDWGDEFVTWRIDHAGNAYWGHYHKDYSNAVRDFETR